MPVRTPAAAFGRHRASNTVRRLGVSRSRHFSRRPIEQRLTGYRRGHYDAPIGRARRRLFQVPGCFPFCIGRLQSDEIAFFHIL